MPKYQNFSLSYWFNIHFTHWAPLQWISFLPVPSCPLCSSTPSSPWAASQSHFYILFSILSSHLLPLLKHMHTTGDLIAWSGGLWCPQIFNRVEVSECADHFYTWCCSNLNHLKASEAVLGALILLEGECCPVQLIELHHAKGYLEGLLVYNSVSILPSLLQMCLLLKVCTAPSHQDSSPNPTANPPVGLSGRSRLGHTNAPDITRTHWFWCHLTNHPAISSKIEWWVLSGHPLHSLWKEWGSWLFSRLDPAISRWSWPTWMWYSGKSFMSWEAVGLLHQFNFWEVVWAKVWVTGTHKALGSRK